MFANKFRIGQRVALARRADDTRTVCAIHRVQQFFYYELSGLHDFLVREDALIALEPYNGQGYVPCPMAQGAK